MKYKKIEVNIAELLEEHGVKFKTNSSDELVMDTCYSCSRSKKLYVDAKTGVYYCQRCQVKGSPVQLLHNYLHISYKEASKILYKNEPTNVFKEFEKEDEVQDNFKLNLNLKKGEDDIVKKHLMEIPPEFEILTEKHKEAWDYLIGRGYTVDDIKKLKLMIVPGESFSEVYKRVEDRIKKENPAISGADLKNKVKDVAIYQGRVIFPLYIDFKVVGLVARDYTGEKTPKVLNSRGTFRNAFFWNYDNVKNNKEIVICEGTSSAVKCGIHRSIATLGKLITKDQIKLLRKTKCEKIYLSYDVGESERESEEEIFKSLSVFYPGKIYKIDLPPYIKTDLKVDGKIKDKLKNWGIDFIETNGIMEFDPVKKYKLSQLLLKDKKFQLEFKEDLEVIKALHKLDYKDAGDYSHKEMDEYIQLAKPMKIKRL